MIQRRLCCLLILGTLPSLVTRGDSLPHVVMIMADDLGWSDVAAYRRAQGLNEPIPTPNIDRLVAGGMMFTDAHAPAALCAPTRFSMMTGSNPYRNGRQWGTWGFEQSSAFSADRIHVTVGDVAKTGGYRTAFFGKMHLGGGSLDYAQTMPTFPTQYGFDYTFCTHGGIQDAPYLYFENDRFVRIDPATPLKPSDPGELTDVTYWAEGAYTIANGTGRINKNQHEGDGDVNWNSSQNGIINSRKAAVFIRDHVANYPAIPFMLYYCPPQVHSPHTPPIDFEPNLDGSPGSPVNVPVAGTTGGNELADIVYELDLQVGSIIAALEDPNGDGDTADSILADTLVMLTSDNGGLGIDNGLFEADGLSRYDSTGELAGSKKMIKEGGHRVPFVAMWGDGNPSASNDTITPGSVSDQLICGHDWVAVMYALTGNSIAENQAMDAVNILPILLGEQDESIPVRDLMLHQSQKDETYPYAIREGDYVLFIDVNLAVGQLYNLADDLSQSTDLLAGMPLTGNANRAEEMLTRFHQHNNPRDTRTTTAYIAPGPDASDPLQVARFTVAPRPLGTSALTMTADSSADLNTPIEYEFTEISGSLGGSDRAWQTSPDFTDTDLLPETTYSYSVSARDSLGNTTPPSSTGRTTTASYDITAPAILIAWHSPETKTDDTPDEAYANITGILTGGKGVEIDRNSTDSNYGLVPFSGSLTTSNAYQLQTSNGQDTMTLTLTNGTGAPIDLGYLHFDYSRTYANAPKDLRVDSSGDITASTVFSFTENTGDLIGKIGNYVDVDADLSTLLDHSLADGESATFTFTVSNAGGVFTGLAIDNLAVTDFSTTDLDSDSDHIPDAVESLWGLDNSVDDAELDLDGDGESNLSEYIAGTNGNDSSEVLKSMLSQSGNLFEISISNTIPNRLYILEYSDDLFDQWTAADAYESGSTQPFAFQYNPINSSPVFFRIRILQTP